MDPYSAEILWMVIVGFIIAFVLAFGIGANDVANSFGTSVGSGVLTIRQACLLATVCEVSGAVLIGYKVSDTMRKGILEVSLYEDHEQELMLGCLSALASSAVWLLVATFLKLPISGTHSIVGSTIGFSLVARGTQGLKWTQLGYIIGSWFVSPVLSGLTSTLLFWAIRRFILRSSYPLKVGLWCLPVFYGITLFVNVFSIVLDGPKLLHMDNIKPWIAVVISLCLGLLASLLVQIFVVPWQRKKILGQTKPSQPVKFSFEDSNESSPSSSPRRNKRPLSLVCDGTQLPAITETTELVSLTNSPLKTNGYCDPGVVKSLEIADGHLRSSFHANGNYKIDPNIIKKAENLLGKDSLDNTDLTITSLNYIDEHQNTINGKGLQNFFDRKKVQKSSEIMNNNPNPITSGKSGTPNSDSTFCITELTVPTVEGNNGVGSFRNSESGVSLDDVITSTISQNSSKVPLIKNRDNAVQLNSVVEEETEDVSALFSFLQVLTATFGSFAHGGNDVSNAIGPLIALFIIYKEGSVKQESETPLYILIYGGLGISVGLWLWGRRVIETIGNDLTKITPSTGFTIEIGAALTVLLASKIGLPISTTHCKVGSVVFVGYASAAGRPQREFTDEETSSDFATERQPAANKAVDWALFRNIVYAWVVTVPVAALLSAGIMFIFCKAVL